MEVQAVFSMVSVISFAMVEKRLRMTEKVIESTAPAAPLPRFRTAALGLSWSLICRTARRAVEVEAMSHPVFMRCLRAFAFMAARNGPAACLARRLPLAGRAVQGVFWGGRCQGPFHSSSTQGLALSAQPLSWGEKFFTSSTIFLNSQRPSSLTYSSS